MANKTATQLLTDHSFTPVDNDIQYGDDVSASLSGALTYSTAKDYYLRGAASAMLLVAAANAPTAVKRRADYVCDGTADESEINSALSIGNVQLTDGDYSIATPIIVNYPGHTLAGVGVGTDMTGAGGGTINRGYGTRVLVASGFTGSYAIDVQQTGATRPAGGVTIRDLEVDGANQGTTVQGIHMRSFNASLDRVVVRRMTSHCVNWHGYTTGEISPNGWSTYDSQMVNCILQASAGAALYLQNGTDLNVTSCVFSDCLYGIWHDGGASCMFTNCHSYSNTNNAVFLDGAGSRDKFIGCKFEHSGQHGFHFNGNGVPGAIEVIIDGCGFGMSGELAAVTGTYSHIKFTGTGSHDRAQIKNCYFHNADSATKLAKYCVDMGSVAVGCTLQGNDFAGSLSSAGVTDDFVNFSGVASDVYAWGNVGLRNHTAFSSSNPSVAVGAGAGTTPPTPVRTGGDVYGSVTWGTGTSPTTGAQWTLTFALPFNITGARIHLSIGNAATWAVQPYVSASSNTTFTISCGVAPAASQGPTIYKVDYFVSC